MKWDNCSRGIPSLEIVGKSGGSVGISFTILCSTFAAYGCITLYISYIPF